MSDGGSFREYLLYSSRMKCSCLMPGGRALRNRSMASSGDRPRTSHRNEQIRNPVRLNP